MNPDRATIRSPGDLLLAPSSARHAYLQARTEAIAAALGTPWRYRADGASHRGLIGTDDGRLLVIHCDQRRFSARGIYPSLPDDAHCSPRDLGALPYHDREPSVTFDPFRPPHQLASDLRRRLIPRYEILLQGVRARLEQRREDRARQVHVAQEAAQILGAAPPPSGVPARDGVSLYARIGHAHVYLDGNLRLELVTIPAEYALSVLRGIIGAWPGDS